MLWYCNQIDPSTQQKYCKAEVKPTTAVLGDKAVPAIWPAA